MSTRKNTISSVLASDFGIEDFEAGVDSYLEGCKADGVEPAKPYSGRLNLRMSSELHSRLAAFVASSGTTINDFINKAIKNELKHVAAL
jgi:predicted HicB family RNase H-like nuclease